MIFKQALQRFRGISVDLLNIRSNAWDGYGLSLLTITWVWVNKVTFSNSGSVFYFNFKKCYEYGGEELKLRAGVLFFDWTVFTKVIKPRKTVCDNCGDYCDSTEHYSGNTPFCSVLCHRDGCWL